MIKFYLIPILFTIIVYFLSSAERKKREKKLNRMREEMKPHPVSPLLFDKRWQAIFRGLELKLADKYEGETIVKFEPTRFFDPDNGYGTFEVITSKGRHFWSGFYDDAIELYKKEVIKNKIAEIKDALKEKESGKFEMPELVYQKTPDEARKIISTVLESKGYVVIFDDNDNTFFVNKEFVDLNDEDENIF